MPTLLKHLIPLLLVAGVLVGGASLVDAHSKSENYWSHYQYAQTESICAYECALKNHDKKDYSCQSCRCKN